LIHFYKRCPSELISIFLKDHSATLTAAKSIYCIRNPTVIKQQDRKC